jgi:hypothetical protein
VSSVKVGAEGTVNDASPWSSNVPVTLIVYDPASAPATTVKDADTPPDADIVQVGLEMMLLGDDVIVQGPASPVAKLDPEIRTLAPARPEAGFNAIVGPTVNMAIAESGGGGLGGVAGGVAGRPLTVTV